MKKFFTPILYPRFPFRVCPAPSSLLMSISCAKKTKNIPQYGIANIPPVVMFNAKIFKPSRLCAVYKVEGLSEEAKNVLDERIQRLRYVRCTRSRAGAVIAVKFVAAGSSFARS